MASGGSGLGVVKRSGVLNRIGEADKDGGTSDITDSKGNSAETNPSSEVSGSSDSSKDMSDCWGDNIGVSSLAAASWSAVEIEVVTKG